MNDSQPKRRAKFVRSWIGLALCLVSATVALASAMTYAGPYRWLMELQLAIFNQYYVEVSYGFTFLGTYGVLLALAWTAVLLRPNVRPETIHNLVIATRGEGHVRGRTSRAQTGAAICLIFGTIVGVLGLGVWRRGVILGNHADMSIAELERGAPPAASHLTLDGVALWDRAVWVESVYDKEFYCPFVSQDWKPGQPVSVFIETKYKISRTPFDESPTQKLTGIRALPPLPGPVRLRLERAGFPPAAGAFVFSLGDSPASYVTGGRVMTIAGAALAGMGALVLMLLRLSKPVSARQSQSGRGFE